ncbi:MAG TPA: hypothetical protein VMG41_05265 [Gemmatimonadales bacterium]|nr:hypothetical protein [Gemmatimonadales bacterium]
MATDDLTPSQRELLERYDGTERIPFLPNALYITTAPHADPAHPVYVEIAWGPGAPEKPIPGSALWRAALERRLEELQDEDPGDVLLRRQIEQSLERYPSLEAWWKWLRTGWLAP